MNLRIGLGTDLHILEPGLPLVLGGVVIPSPFGCRAHSDGDVLFHALIDALFGATGQGDIGDHFPPSDTKYKHISSAVLLQQCLSTVQALGFSLVNIDAVITLQEPKLFPHKMEIRQSLAVYLALPLDCVSVKAKTNEGVDAVGHGQAISAQVIALLQKKDTLSLGT